MNFPNKYLSLAVIFSTVLITTGCIVAPSNNDKGYSHQNNYDKIDISHLHDIYEDEANRRLSAKDFRQVRVNESGNTKWLNSRTNQCVEVLAYEGRVSSVVERDLYVCNEHSGHHNNSGTSEWDRGCSDAKSGSYDRSGNAGQGYEEGWNSCHNR